MLKRGLKVGAAGLVAVATGSVLAPLAAPAQTVAGVLGSPSAPEDASFDVGIDTRTGVAMLEHRYDSPFALTGTIDKVTFDLDPAG